MIGTTPVALCAMACRGAARDSSWARRMAIGAVLIAVALSVLSSEGLAACSPPAGNNVSATCTGTTNNQNGTNGYGTGAETGLTVNVVNGASLVGTNNGIAASTVTVTNAGTISGTVIAGINTVSATVTNSGTISGNSFGIFALTTATVTNSGTILGRNVAGIVADTNATVTNSGTISGGMFGIEAVTTATVTNSGTVSGGQFGIFAGGTAIVTNSGTISGTGPNSFGIQAANAMVTNFGTISGSTGIFSVGAATVTNSGTIIGTAGPALQFSGAADTLTLLPGSKIIGAINLGGGGDTINFRTGNQNLTFDTLAGATVTSNVPFVVSGNRAVTIDPTTFGMADRVVMDFTRAISGIIDDRTGETASLTGGILGFAPVGTAAAGIEDPLAHFAGNAYAASEAVVFKNPTASTADGAAIWARGFGGERIQRADGSTLGGTDNFYGGAIGFDRMVRSDLRLGGFIGGGNTSLIVDQNAGSANSNIVFGGLYGRYDLGAAFLKFGLLGGYTANTTSRNINNNLAAGGLETATASFGGWFASPEIAYGYHYRLANNWTLTPAARLRYVAAEFDGSTESGSTADLTVASRTAQNIEERGDLTLAKTTSYDFGQSSISLLVGVLGLQRVGDATVNTILLGQSLAFATPGKNDVAGVYAGAGFDWRTRSGWSFFASGDFLVMTDSSTVITGKGGVKLAF